MRHELHQSARASEALYDELLDRTTELMDVQEDNHVLNGMQINSELERALYDQQEPERDVQSRLVDADKGRGKWKRISQRLFHNIVLKPLLIQLTVKHIRSSAYTSHSMARVMGLKNMRLIKPAELELCVCCGPLHLLRDFLQRLKRRRVRRLHSRQSARSTRARK
jgi:hypothetical protein